MPVVVGEVAVWVPWEVPDEGTAEPAGPAPTALTIHSSDAPTTKSAVVTRRPAGLGGPWPITPVDGTRSAEHIGMLRARMEALALAQPRVGKDVALDLVYAFPSPEESLLSEIGELRRPQ
jgi:hypothetical protein